MSKIDLSKAKIGDKFINKEGTVLELIKVHSGYEYPYELKDELGHSYLVTNDGSYVEGEDDSLDLVLVFDELLSAMEIEREYRINRDMQKITDIADEEKQELQRRQEVVELADRIFFSERGSAYSFKDYIEVAEHSVNMINQYLKEGKL